MCINLFVDNQTTLNIDFLHSPTSLTHVMSTDEMPSKCYSASYRADGNILLGCKDGVRLFNIIDKSVTLFKTSFKRVTSVLEHHNAIYILHREEDTCGVVVCLPDLSSSQTLFEFENTGTSAAAMTLSDKYIVAWNPIDKEQLIIDLMQKEFPYRDHNYTSILGKKSTVEVSSDFHIIT